MLRRQVVAIHFVGEQNVAACFFQGNAARELQSARRTFRVFKHAEIGSFQNYFARIWLESRSIEQDRKWHSRPLCVAYCAEVPLNPFYLWLEKIPIVPSAFQSHRSRDGPDRHEFLVVNREWLSHFPLYVQPPRIAIDRRDRKMGSNIERFRRRNKAVHRRKRHLQI